MPCGAIQAEGYAIRDMQIYAGPTRESVTERIGVKADAIWDDCASRTSPTELGTLVVHPDASDWAFVQVVVGLLHRKADGTIETRSADACAFEEPNNRNCLMATRSFQYTRRATGYVPVSLRASCVPKWFQCPKGETCIDGECTSDNVTPSPTLLPDGVKDSGSSMPETSVTDAGGDAPAPRALAELALGLDHTCVRYNSGKVACWGENTSGQLGYDDKARRGATPNSMGANLPFVRLSGKATAVAAGISRTCAVIADGILKCWGENGYGELGLEDTNDRGDVPPEMATLDPVLGFDSSTLVAQASLGFTHSCATLLGMPQLRCWGINAQGQLGQGTTDDHGALPGTMTVDSLPFVDAGGTILSIGAGASHTCILIQDPNGATAIKCWGKNDNAAGSRGPGVLGLGHLENRGDKSADSIAALPTVKLGTGALVRQLAVGAYHTCAILDLGTVKNGVKCWGINNFGQLGTGDTRFRGGSNSATDQVITTIYGSTTMGPMGDSLPFVALGTARQAVAIAAGAYHTCALLDDGSVKCWGHNKDGQLGVGDIKDRGTVAVLMGDALPAVDLGLDNGDRVVSIFAGAGSGIDSDFATHTCVLLASDRVKCWGRNTEGQLGLEDAQSRGGNPNSMGKSLPYVALPAPQ